MTKRTFKLKVKEFVPEKRLVWGDAMGNRVYTIDKGLAEERVLCLPCPKKLVVRFSRCLPDTFLSFDESFETVCC